MPVLVWEWKGWNALGIEAGESSESMGVSEVSSEGVGGGRSGVPISGSWTLCFDLRLGDNAALDSAVDAATEDEIFNFLGALFLDLGNEFV